MVINPGRILGKIAGFSTAVGCAAVSRCQPREVSVGTSDTVCDVEL